MLKRSLEHSGNFELVNDVIGKHFKLRKIRINTSNWKCLISLRNFKPINLRSLTKYSRLMLSTIGKSIIRNLKYFWLVKSWVWELNIKSLRKSKHSKN